ncbi:hypothetical protein EPUS_03135 [Endocarpon pusillum Z07020]|uniref:Uncharacterized protein n=1 Tax=Endocarpon pusillum (strain Z07020 / HMAS-L-300199) TaxID=1263415 RepID=U1G7B7_ENDPU|nr:uncharacterized protein EPUS_03135 [Endocarpon pusillum Z07020]ERF73302.1 hypothetical protein EPUS_03135 [Endocarpon pusillum Z07020]
MSNKDRVYVALYFRQGISNEPALRQEYQHAAYHWAILVMPKSSEGEGSTYDVKYQDAYSNLPGSGGWGYFYRGEADMRQSRAILGQVMIGKLPKNIGSGDVDQMLRRIPIPQDNTDPVQNCVSWLVHAIQELQQHECAEQFDVNQFMNDALQLGDRKVSQDPLLRSQPFKENYTSRKFP